MKFQIFAGLVLVGLVLVSAEEKKDKRGVSDLGYGVDNHGNNGLEQNSYDHALLLLCTVYQLYIKVVYLIEEGERSADANHNFTAFVISLFIAARRRCC
ncbi:hypothetical protein CBL_08102 [Carabus blaptoides fortunei]